MSDHIHVHIEATSVITSLVPGKWKTLLAEHPNQSLVKFFTTGITNGFRIGFNHHKEACGQSRRICTVYSFFSVLNSVLLYIAKDHKIYEIIINLNYSYNLNAYPTGSIISPLSKIIQIFYQRLGTVHLTNLANELFKEGLKHLFSLADKILQLLQILKVPPCASHWSYNNAVCGKLILHMVTSRCTYLQWDNCMFPLNSMRSSTPNLPHSCNKS